MFLYVSAWPTGVEFLMHIDNVQFIQENISLLKIFMHLYNTPFIEHKCSLPKEVDQKYHYYKDLHK